MKNKQVSYDHFLEKFIDELVDTRKSLGTTQKKMGESLGKPQSSIARFENKKIREPWLKFLFEYCSVIEKVIGISSGNGSDAINAETKLKLLSGIDKLIEELNTSRWVFMLLYLLFSHRWKQTSHWKNQSY